MQSLKLRLVTAAATASALICLVLETAPRLRF